VPEYPLLARLYTAGSLTAIDGGVRFAVRNRLFDATIVRVDEVRIDGEAVDPAAIEVVTDDGTRHRADAVAGLTFPLGTRLTVEVAGRRLGPGPHEIAVAVHTDPFGPLAFRVVDHLAAPLAGRRSVPRLDDDWSDEAVAARRDFLSEVAGFRPEHLFATTIPPAAARGNIESLVGAAQVPVGLAGPLRINGEHASGDFYVPLATTEGTLVASYNRGMKALTLAGGVTTTVLEDHMQRAPVFAFDSAREARDFAAFVDTHVEELRAVAAATTRHGEL
jgi:hydroxymethylglutaryl-CoA reductase (NADPH)